MKNTLIKKVLSVAHHRNGVSGTPFSVVLFTDRETNETFIGIVPDQDENKWNSFVLSAEKAVNGDIAFASNSYRGDNYAPELKAAIAAAEGK